MKVSINSRIYLRCKRGSELDLKFIEALTYTMPITNPNEIPEVICTYQRVSEEIVSLPSGREDLLPKDAEIVDRRSYNLLDEFPKFKMTLRPDQQEIYDKVDGSAFIVANASFGKTFTALAIAGKLKCKTLVVCHTTSLRQQWLQEIEKVYGFTPGIIGSGSFDMSKPITVGNIQTLRKHTAKLAASFGFVILDEAHHAPAKTFTDFLNGLRAAYYLGLSATPNRKDGRSVLLADYISPYVLTAEKANQMMAEVHLFESTARLSDNAMVPWANRINDLYAQDDWYNTCFNVMTSYLNAGRTVLFVSDRTDLLKRLAHETGQIFVTGDVALDDRPVLIQALQDKKVGGLCGTYTIFSEGISVPSIDCLIIGMTMNNDALLEQLVGRAIRIQEGKKKPIIADIGVRGSTARKHRNARMAYYVKEGYQTKNFGI